MPSRLKSESERELLELIRRQPLGEFPSDELERLRDALTESETFLEVLLEEFPAEELDEALARIDSSVALVLAEVLRRHRSRSRRRLAVVGSCAAALLALLGLALFSPPWLADVVASKNIADPNVPSEPRNDDANKLKDATDLSGSDASATKSSKTPQQSGDPKSPLSSWKPSPSPLSSKKPSDAASKKDDDTSKKPSDAVKPEGPQDLEAKLAQRQATREEIQAAEADAHPLIMEMSKEGYNLWAELKTALQADAREDVCNIVRTAPSVAEIGLVPDFRDPNLYVPLRTAILLAMRDRAELSRTMRETFGELAALRLNRALAESDFQEIEAVANQFCGTEAASDAHRALGDRELSSGRLPAAMGRYREAARQALPWQRKVIEARRRLAAALMGREHGQPATDRVELGDASMSSREFERMIAELLAKHASRPAPAGGMSASETPLAPPPGPRRPREVTEFPIGDRGWNATGRDVFDVLRDGLDWSGRSMSVAFHGDVMILGNRRNVGAVSLASGKELWRQEFSFIQGYAPTWYWQSFRPLITKGNVYSRYLTKYGPALACLQLETGGLSWSRQPGDHIASDPL
ncbi:MAG: hypothetical protein N2C14_34240, partial [Planctomycetales bacterium]